MELKTKAGQTPLELSTEFINNMKDVKSGSEDMDKLFDFYVQLETKPMPPQEVIDMVKHVAHTDYDASSVDYMINMKPNITLVCLAWIAQQCGPIPESLNTLIGLYCTYFYKDHGANEQITLKWLGETVGKGKLINFRAVWPWFSASKCEDGISCFSKLKR